MQKDAEQGLCVFATYQLHMLEGISTGKRYLPSEKVCCTMSMTANPSNTRQRLRLRRNIVQSSVESHKRMAAQRLLACTKTQNKQLQLQDLKVYLGRLKNAVDLLRRFADRFWWSQGHLSDSAVATRFTEFLAQRFPEQVAVLSAEGN